MRRLIALALVVILAPGQALAWGNTGHRILGVAAARALPAEVPAFLRTRQAIADVGELSREPDRSKAAGRVHDQDRDPGHFIDLHEDGTVLLGPPMLPLATTRADYEASLQAHKLNSWSAGYLPYTIIDRWQQLLIDFAYWRVLEAAENNRAWRTNQAWFQADRRRREALILRDIGELSHMVGDGSQPLHVTTHFNGWGEYPNPAGYSMARSFHGVFEGDVVRDSVRPKAVEAGVAPLRLCGCSIEQRTADYLMASNRLVVPLYELEKAGGLAKGDPRGAAFATRQMSAGASELRDMIVEAWRASLDHRVGWRPIAVRDVLSGQVDPYASLRGVD